MKRSYSCLLFDADGTLFDYDRAETFALEKTFASADLLFEVATVPTYRQINGLMWRDYEAGKISQQNLRYERFARLLRALNLKGDARQLATIYQHQLGQAAFLIDGAEALINALRGRYRLAMVTNGLHGVQRSRLALSPLHDAFETVIISGEIGVAKPDRRFFESTFAALNQPIKEEVLIIGDSFASDMRGGIDFGIDTCWLNPTGDAWPGLEGPTIEINTLSELGEILSVGP